MYVEYIFRYGPFFTKISAILCCSVLRVEKRYIQKYKTRAINVSKTYPISRVPTQAIFSLFLMKHISKCLLFTISIATIVSCLDSVSKMVSLLPLSHSSVQPESKNVCHIMWLPMASLALRKTNSFPGLTKTHRCHCSYLSDPSHSSFPFSLLSRNIGLLHVLLTYTVHCHFWNFD